MTTTMYQSAGKDNDSSNERDNNSNTTSKTNNNTNNKNDKNDHDEVDDDEGDNLVSYEDLMRDPDLYQMENNASKKRKNNLFLFDSIGKAFNAVLWTFVISSLVLQNFGYTFVVDSPRSSTNEYSTARIRIDTLENKAFMLEMEGKDEQAARMRKKIKGYTQNYSNLESIE